MLQRADGGCTDSARISCRSIRNAQRKYSDKLEIRVLELPKLSQYEYPETALLNWAKFINAEKKEEMEKMAQKDDSLKKAYERVLEMSADEKKRLEYEEREKVIRDYNSQMKSNWKSGHKAGVAEGHKAGLAEGRELGITEGRELGITEGKAESILELLEELGEVPEELRDRVKKEVDLVVLKNWLRIAAKVESIEDFVEKTF